jgi:hypothetical protein
MASIKTLSNDSSVDDFLDTIADEKIKRDSFQLLDLFTSATEEIPKMWVRV